MASTAPNDAVRGGRGEKEKEKERAPPPREVPC